MLNIFAEKNDEFCDLSCQNLLTSCTPGMNKFKSNTNSFYYEIITNKVDVQNPDVQKTKMSEI